MEKSPPRSGGKAKGRRAQRVCAWGWGPTRIKRRSAAAHTIALVPITVRSKKRVRSQHFPLKDPAAEARPDTFHDAQRATEMLRNIRLRQLTLRPDAVARVV
jgi:hypothetical protein